MATVISNCYLSKNMSTVLSDSSQNWDISSEDSSNVNMSSATTVSNGSQNSNMAIVLSDTSSNNIGVIGVLEVIDILQARHAFVSGGRDRCERPLMIWPSQGSLCELSYEEYKSLVTYLATIPSEEDVESGFTIVIDGRESKWPSLRKIIGQLSEYFPCLIARLIVLQPKSMLQRIMKNMQSAHHETIKFPLVFCSSLGELHEWIAPDQLTPDLGGSLIYNHDQWIEYRTAIESFTLNAYRIGRGLHLLADQLLEIDLPQEIDSLSSAVEEQRFRSSELLADLDGAITRGVTLLDNVKRLNYETDSSPRKSLSPDKQLHVCSIERVLVQLYESQHNFRQFWKAHDHLLNQSLRITQFHIKNSQIQIALTAYLSQLAGASLRPLTRLSSSVELTRTAVALERTLVDSVPVLQCAEELACEGDKIVDDDNPELRAKMDDYSGAVSSRISSVRSKCAALRGQILRCRTELPLAVAQLHYNAKILAQLEVIDELCCRGQNLAVSAASDNLRSANLLQVNMDLDSFKKLQGELQQAPLFDLQSLLEEKASTVVEDTEGLHKRVADTLERLHELRSLCDEQLVKLNSLQALHERTESQMKKSIEDKVAAQTAVGLSRRRPSQTSSGKEMAALKNTATGTRNGESKITAAVEISSVQAVNMVCRTCVNSTEVGVDDANFSKGALEASAAATALVLAEPGWPSSPHVPMSEKSALNDPAVLMTAKRGHVMRELLTTEQDFVADLADVWRVYGARLRSSSATQQLENLLQAAGINGGHSPSLKRSGAASIILGNWEELLILHRDCLLPQFTVCQDTPSHVGRCFTQARHQFEAVYSTYCLNKPHSDQLLVDTGAQNLPLLRNCQVELKHSLPLSAFLLKPVQRIQKYQLLLKDMQKYCCRADDIVSLDEALCTMLRVLNYVNEAMSQKDIIGYEGHLSSLGRLLLHGSFQMSQSSAARTSIISASSNSASSSSASSSASVNLKLLSSTKSRPFFSFKQRHVFLYENALLVCKEVGERFEFLAEVPTMKVGITECVKKDRHPRRRFELWMDQRSLVYTLQAINGDVRLQWIVALKDLLQRQFERLKMAAASQRAQEAMILASASSLTLDHEQIEQSPNQIQKQVIEQSLASIVKEEDRHSLASVSSESSTTSSIDSTSSSSSSSSLSSCSSSPSS